MITVSVPGKVHLMGEHAVVYGYPAILSAINLRLTMTISPGKKDIIIKSSEPADYIKHALGIVQKHYQIDKLPPMTINVESEIPAGYHLGSSAATAVATVGAAMYFLRKIWNPTLINQLAYEAEKKQHGNPSGGDNTAVTTGGFLWFRKELEFLKSLWQLPFKLPDSLNHFFLIDTGRPKESTGEMVAFVKSQMLNHKSQIENHFRLNELQVKRIATAIKEADENELINAIKTGESSLEKIGVVSKKVIPIIRTIEKAGGAAKILGGGGRADGVGFLLAYHHDPESITKKYNLKIKKIKLGEEGVRLEKK